MSFNLFCGTSPGRPGPPAAVKAAISKLHASIVSITGIASSELNSSFQANGNGSPMCLRGIGVLIHPTLVLTTHSTIPTPASIKDANLSFCLDMASLSYVKRKFVPEIFFQTDAELDLTIVSCEIVAPDIETLALDTTRLSRRALRKGRTAFVMGCQAKEPEDVVILEGGIVGVQKAVGQPKHVFFQTGEGLWMPGSAGFDEFGTFSFLVTSPPGDKRSSAFGGLFSSTYPKQHAISIQVVKDWVEPLWRMNRDEVFQGPQLALAVAATAVVDNGFKRPSLEENSLQKQKSIEPRSSVFLDTAPISTPIRQTTLRAVKSVEKVPTPPASPPQNWRGVPDQIKPATKTVGVETMNEETESEFEKRSPKNAKVAKRRPRDQSPKGAVARERRARREEFMAAKKNKGLKRRMDKGTKAAEPEKDNASVQTELFVTEADIKPMIIVSRPGTPEPGTRPAGEGGRKGHRERWSLPEDGHGLDFLREMDEAPPPPPTVIRRSRASLPSLAAPRSNSLQEVESVPAWMERYYARGRSLSELPSRASSAGATPPRPRRQVVSDADPELDGDDSASISGSSLRSLQHAGSAYFKPTISYMQKRNPAQRDSILARQASQNALPRWS
ncbi:hypothetical protein GOP47_0001450 [Adiantum capillus-veneris]|uniref:Uncharacterized protein n=1 Tax=Adiantum capillus-veneris TaxID=13818 RepID=A0A9D4V8W5_ADICA|nr:hypothetical protein GOP47_0001450 [Adiantum capillus-veneris]